MADFEEKLLMTSCSNVEEREYIEKRRKHNVFCIISFFGIISDECCRKRAETIFDIAFYQSDHSCAESLAKASDLIERDYRAFNCATLLRYRVNIHRRRCIY